jgi:anti-sigma B factor antagonist
LKFDQEAVSGVTFFTPDIQFLDVSNAPDFKSSVLPAMELAAVVALDLSKIDFMDSTGLGAMVACLRQVEARSGRLYLCNLGPKVRSLFELVRLYKVFDIVNTREECLRAAGA